MVQRNGFSAVLGAALLLVVTPWLGCGTSHDFEAHPPSSAGDAGETAGGMGNVSNVAGGEGGDSASGGGQYCAFTACGGICTDTTADPEHCGACDQSCTALPHLGMTADVTCSGSVCQVPASACAEGYAHCSTDPADGCETDLNAPEHCGSCKTSCGADAPFCALGKCSANCPAEAPTECGKVCSDLTSDPLHCGDCAKACPAPAGGGQATCADSKCAVECLGGFHQCSGTTDCASDTDKDKCTASCTACAVANGTATCVGNACVTQSCSANFHKCPDSSCGSDVDKSKCTSACIACPQVANAEAPTCAANACVTKCKPGFKACNGKCVDPAVDNSCGGHPLATGDGVACAIKSGGNVWCWTGDSMSSPKQVSNLSAVTQLAVFQEACALKSDGTLWCWSPVAPVTPATDRSAGMKFKQIAVSGNSACSYAGVATTDKVYCWDGAKWTQKGTQLGTHVSLQPNSPYDAYSRGTDGSIWKWVSGGVPFRLQSAGFSEVSAGDSSGSLESLVRRTTSGVVSNDSVDMDVGELVGSTVFTQISAGSIGGCALDAAGKVGCWGYGPFGQLGNGMQPESETDMVQFGGSAFRANAISRGPLWTCALKTDGTVWCAGKDVAPGDGKLHQVNIVVP